MNIFRKLIKRREHSESEDAVKKLYNMLRKHGDEILLGESNLSLTTPVLIILNSFFEKLTEGVNQSCFQVTDCSEDSTEINFIFDFIQKIVSLKLISGVINSDCPLLTLHFFKALHTLEIRKVPISYVKNLHLLRRQLKSLKCCRSVTSIHETIESFGKGTDEQYQLPNLTQLDLSFNKIVSLDDESLKLVPALEKLNLSYNCITCADSETLPGVQHLNVGYNLLTFVPGFNSTLASTLTHLIIRNNNIASLDGVEALNSLKALDVTSNCLLDFNRLAPLAYLEKLITVGLKDNPIYFNENYRTCVVRKLSPVRRRGKITIDGLKLNSEEFYQLGQDVKPIPLTSYISYFPKDTISKQFNATKDLHSTPVLQKKTRKIRNAAIKEMACHPLNGSIDSTTSGISSIKSHENGISENVTPMTAATSHSSISHSHSQNTSFLCDSMSSETRKRNDSHIYSSKKCHVSNSVIWVNTETGEQTGSSLEKVEYDTWAGEEENKSQQLSLHDASSSSMDSLFMDSEDTGEVEVTMETTDVEGCCVTEQVADEHYDTHEYMDEENQECEFAYLVKNIPTTTEAQLMEEEEDFEYLFLVFYPPYLVEKTDCGKLRTRLDLNYLGSVTHIDLCVRLTFDLQRADWRWREFEFEQRDHMDHFLRSVQPYAVRNYQKKLAQMAHCECLKCGVTFLTKSFTKDTTCNDCGSTMIVEKHNTAAVNISTPDDEQPIKQYLSTSLPLTDSPINSALDELRSLPTILDSVLLDDTIFTANPSSSIKYCSTLPVKLPPSSRSSSVSSRRPALTQVETKDTLYCEDILKCDHRLMLYFSLNVYAEEEESFLCQLKCKCVTSAKAESFECLLNVSSHSLYIFTILNPTSVSPGTSLKKVTTCPISKVKLVAPGYNYQSFILETSKPAMRYKFLTGNCQKTFKMLGVLEVKFLQEKEVYSALCHPRTLSNINIQVLGREESYIEKTDRLFTQISTFIHPPLLQSRKCRLRTFHQVFVAKELVDWLCLHKEASNQTEAIMLCQQLLSDGQIIEVVTKHGQFKNDNTWYRFAQCTEEDESEANTSKDDTISYLSENEDVSNDVKIYLICHVKLLEKAGGKQLVSLICTQTHVFATIESHVWPLPRTYAPAAVPHNQFKTLDARKITAVESLEFYEDDPCMVTITFLAEEEEVYWLVSANNTAQLDKLTSFLKCCWEGLFAVELTSLFQPTCLL